MRTSLLALLLCLAAAPAAADRYTRGLAAFQQMDCTQCHTVGWRNEAAARPSGSKAVDLTRVVDGKDDKDLRRWLEKPQAVRPDTACTHRALSAEQIADLVRFLHSRSKPMPQKPRIDPTATLIREPALTPGQPPRRHEERHEERHP